MKELFIFILGEGNFLGDSYSCSILVGRILEVAKFYPRLRVDLYVSLSLIGETSLLRSQEAFWGTSFLLGLKASMCGSSLSCLMTFEAVCSVFKAAAIWEADLSECIWKTSDFGTAIFNGHLFKF